MLISHKYLISITLCSGCISFLNFALAFYHFFLDRKHQNLPNHASGIIIGIVTSHFFKNIIHGEVPSDTLVGWSVAQGEQYWSGTLRKRIPPCFPCVQYEVDNKVYIRIVGEGVWSNTWRIGQEVTVIYNDASPGTCFIQGDPSNKANAILHVYLGIFFLIVCLISMLLLIF